MRRLLTRHAGVALAALGLAACGGVPGRVENASSRGLVRADEIDAAFNLLMDGNISKARKALRDILKRDPLNASARMLLDSSQGDARHALGAQSYPYVVRSGDTLQQVSARYLGNRLKAYQLMRYNGLKAPAMLVAGQTLRIPGQVQEAQSAGRAEPRREPARAPSAQATASRVPVPRKPAVPAAPARNPAAARKARTAGLAALNQGKVSHAVALLHRAVALDPADPANPAALARAERIAATVRARK